MRQIRTDRNAITQLIIPYCLVVFFNTICWIIGFILSFTGIIVGSFIIYLFVGIISLIFNIYLWCYMCSVVNDLNYACCYIEDNVDVSPHYLLVVLLTGVTCGFYTFWWWFKQGNRLQRNLERCGFKTSNNGTTYLLWNIIGIFLLGFGPVIAIHLFTKDLNELGKRFRNAGRSGNRYIDGNGYNNGMRYNGGNGYNNRECYHNGIDNNNRQYGAVSASNTPIVVCMSGEYAGQQFSMSNGYLMIGRDSQRANLILTSSQISKQHCYIKYDAQSDSYLVIDYSTNGVFFGDGSRMKPNSQTMVRRGTTIRLGGNNVFQLN